MYYNHHIHCQAFHKTSNTILTQGNYYNNKCEFVIILQVITVLLNFFYSYEKNNSMQVYSMVSLVHTIKLM